MRETWYVLDDGTPVDPNECATGDDGVLRHASGSAVAMRGQVPRSRGMDSHEIEAARTSQEPKPAPQDAPSGKGRELKPEEAKRGYKTRKA